MHAIWREPEGQAGKLVKLDKLAKQARRDLTANPKKAAILGLMLLVAGYFWGPLLWKWLAPAKAKGGKDSQTALILEDDPLEVTPQAKPGALRPFRWEKVRQQIRSDRFMVPASFEKHWPNPFAPLPVAAQAPQGAEGTPTEAETAAARQEKELTPESAGLKLASVAIGPKRRTATISGNTYREGQTIATGGGDNVAANHPAFRLVRIEPHGVELEHDGRTWWLEFDKPKLAHGDEIEPAAGHERH